MPRYLSVKNFDQYQHYKNRNPPWIKLHKSLYGDREFLQLSIEARYLYVGLLTLFSECNNRLVEDVEFIAHRLGIPVAKVNLTPLLQRTEHGETVGFLAIDGTAADVATEPTGKNAKVGKVSDEEFVAKLLANPAYAHCDVGAELAKMDAWLLANPRRQKTRSFVVNWLNKIQKPLAATVGGGGCQWKVQSGYKTVHCGQPVVGGARHPFCAAHLQDRERLDRRMEEERQRGGGALA